MSKGFPFVGAGDASYFEWAEVLVRFEREPTAAERRAITKDIPSPIGDVTWTGPLLSAASEQGVGRLIRAAYAVPKKPPKGLVMQNRFAQAGPTADARFNAHIEAWLDAAHAVVPVLIAYRRQDLEAGGTRLSAWHQESMKKLPRVLEALAKHAQAEDADLGARLLRAAEAEQIAINRTLKQTIASLGRAAKKAAEADAEARWAKVHDEREKRIAALETEAKKSRRKPVASPAVLAALAKLEPHLPAFVKRLRKIDPKEVAVSAGATKRAIDAVERELEEKLVPEHRALLSALDGGLVRGIAIAGTPESGARGRDELVALSRVYASTEKTGEVFAVTVATAGKTLLQARMLGGKANVFLQDGPDGRIVKQARTLDALLEALLKAAK